MSREEQELRDVERQMEEQLIQQYSQVGSRRERGRERRQEGKGLGLRGSGAHDLHVGARDGVAG